MPWLLDGNNLARGGDRETVRRAALAVARQERVRILIFFDGAPPSGAGAVASLGQVEIRYAGHADTAILAFLKGGGHGWRVATDDRELGRKARLTGAEVVPSAGFWHKARAAEDVTEARPAAGDDLAAELAFFADESQRLPGSSIGAGRRAARRRRRKTVR